MPTDELIDDVHLLQQGGIEVLGRMPWSSNATFLTEVTLDERTTRAVYKPLRGERPLWDFPPGLHRREVAAWELSEALGWSLVPPTVLRPDAPLGEGSLQQFVEADFEQHYFTLYEERPALHEQLRAVCTFDLLVNNTDRKSGHVLLGPGERIWAIDNALCFSTEFKLRTVIWEFGGEPVPEPLLEAVARLADDVPERVAGALDPDEVAALQERARALRQRPVFPIDRTGRRYPWPLV